MKRKEDYSFLKKEIKQIELLLEKKDFKAIEKIYKEIEPIFALEFKTTKTKQLLAKNDEDIITAKKTISKLNNIIEDRELKNWKKSLGKPLSPETSLVYISKIFNISAISFVKDLIHENYQTFSNKFRFDKELFINGSIPYAFNRDLKGLRLANFFRAVNLADKPSSKILKDDAESLLKMGKILSKYSLTDNLKLEVIVFMDFSSKKIIQVDYSKMKITSSEVLRTNFKYYYKEVFARHDYEYLTKVNIHKLNYNEILQDMLIDSDNIEKTIRQRISTVNERDKESSFIKRIPIKKII